MLSLAAMTSVSIGAYADADLTGKINTETLSDWGTSEGLSYGENGILVSTGAPMEYTIGQLVKGRYTLGAATLTNARLSVKGIEMESDGTFTLDETTTVVIEVKAVNAGGYSVGGFSLTHNYDYQAAAQQLRSSLVEVTARLQNCSGKEAENLTKRASEIAGKILVLEGNDDDTLYKAYEDYKLYEGVDQSTVADEIGTFKKEVQELVDKTVATANAKAVVLRLKESLAEVKPQLDAATDYAKTTKGYSGEYTTLSNYLDNMAKAIEAAYADGSATTKYTDDNLAAIEVEKGKEIADLSQKIADADADHRAYEEVLPLVDAAKTKYTETLAAMKEATSGEDKGSVYENMYETDKERLSEAMDILGRVGMTENNGTANMHDNAAETMDNNKAEITRAEAIIAGVAAEYPDKVDVREAAYTTATEAVAGLQAILDNLTKDLNGAGLAADYAADGVGVQTLINTLMNRIDDARKDYTICEFVDGSEYTAGLQGIDDAISEVNAKAGSQLSNYRAWKAMDDEITNLTNILADAGNALKDKVSANGEYTADGKYDDVRGEIEKAISDYRNAADKSRNAGTAVSVKEEHSGTFATISAMITACQSNADEAVARYDAMTEALAAANEALTRLEQTVTNPDVTLSDGTTTYGKKLTRLAADIDGLEGKVADATAKAVSHYDAMMTLAVEDAEEITAQIEALAVSYATDKERYDATNVELAAKVLSDAVANSIDKLRTDIAGFREAVELLGADYPGAGGITESIDALEDALNAIDEERPTYNEGDPMDNVIELMASLMEVNERIADLEEQHASGIRSTIDGAKTTVENNNANKTEAEQLIAAIRENLTDAKATYKDDNLFTDDDKVTPSDDPERTDAFVQWSERLANFVDAKEVEIQQSYETYKLATEWTDDEREGGSYKSILTGNKEESVALLDMAKKEKANYDAYTSLMNDKTTSIAVVRASIDKAVANIEKLIGSDMRGKGSGFDYYVNTVLRGTFTEKCDKLEADVKAAYSSYEASTGQEKLSTYIKMLNNDVTNQASLADGNEQAHAEQVEMGKNVLDYWAEVYADISKNDQSSLKDENLEELRNMQDEILELDTQVRSDWGEGLSSANNSNTLGKYGKINNRIKTISDKLNSKGYDELIDSDNNQRYDDFLTAVGETYNVYIDAVNVIAKITNTTIDQDYADKVADVMESSNNIYAYSEKISDLRREAAETKEHTSSPELWDKDLSYKEQAGQLADEITSLRTELVSKVYDVATDHLQSKVTEAEQQLNNAIVALKSQGYSKDVINGAFPDVRALIRDINQESGAAYLTKEEYVIYADDMLADLLRVEELIGRGLQAAAGKEWDVIIRAKNTQIAEEKKDMEEYVANGYLNADELTVYNELVDATVRRAESQAAEAKAAGDLYGQLPDLKVLLAQFDAESSYGELIGNAKKDAANKAAREELLSTIDEVQTELDALERYAREYFIYHDLVSTINNLQTRIDNLTANVDLNYNRGTAADEDLKAQVEDTKAEISTSISNSKDMFDILEGIKLTAETAKLHNLNADVNADDINEHDAMHLRINALEADVNKAVQSDEGKHEALISMEGDIAQLKTELETKKQADAVTDAIAKTESILAELQSAYDAERAVLDGCHDEVKKEYDKALTAIGDDVEAVRADFAKRQADDTLLFYQDYITRSIETISKELTALTAAISTAEAPYIANDEAYLRLTAQIENLRAELTAVSGRIGGYRSEVADDPSLKVSEEKISNEIEQLTNSVDEAYAKVSLTTESDSYQGDFARITKLTTALDKNAANYQANLDINDLTNAAKAAKAIIDSHRYSEANKDALRLSCSGINNAITSLSKFKSDAYSNGYVTADIDGNELADVLAVDFMAEAFPAINEKIAQLTADIRTLASDAESLSYILGDVNGDGLVLVDDYRTVLSVVLGMETIEEGTNTFLAADINGDKRINVGDLMGVAGLINGTFSAAAQQAARRMPAASDEALVLSATGEGTQQRIAISLSGGSRAYVGCQMDITLPAGVTLCGEGTGASGLTLSSADLADGAHRIVLSSLDGAEMQADGETIVWLDVNVAHSYAGEGIEVTGIMLADASARVYTLAGLTGGETTGIRTVSLGEAVKSKVYSVGGKLMDGLKRGVNIVRGADGSTKKVIVK